MFLDFKGGKYGVFKYQLYDNELRHNFGNGFGARSPYSGIGGTILTAVFPNGTPSASKCFCPHRTLSASLVRSFRKSRVPFVSRTR